MCKADEIRLRSNAGELRTINMKQQLHQLQQPGPCITVRDLKQRASKEFPTSGPSVDQVRLIVVDKPLDNDSAPLCECGIKPETVVQMVRKVNGG